MRARNTATECFADEWKGDFSLYILTPLVAQLKILTVLLLNALGPWKRKLLAGNNILHF